MGAGLIKEGAEITPLVKNSTWVKGILVVQNLINGGAGSNPTKSETWIKGILVIERSMGVELN